MLRLTWLQRSWFIGWCYGRMILQMILSGRFREALVERLRRFEQCDQPTFTYRLDHESIAVTMHNRLVSRQLELDGNANRLIAAVSKQSDVPSL